MTALNDIIIAVIVAMAENRVIGRDNQLPWHLPGDLQYFKANTLGKPIVMGRKTFESIGRPLPGRANIIVTRDQYYSAEGVRVVHDVAGALSLARQIALSDGADELMVIGGAELYREVLPWSEKLYLTRVLAEVEGDAYFPVLQTTEWQLLSNTRNKASDDNPYDYNFEVYRRLK